MAKIIFNGQEYDSPEAMPPEVRKLYDMAAGMFADKDGDGAPDIFEGMLSGQQISAATHIIVDGKSYASLNDLPPELRQRYEQAFSRLDANRDGVPDMFAGSAATPAPAPGLAAPSSSTSVPQVRVIGEGGGLGGMRPLMIALIVVLLIAAAFVIGTMIGR
jgi:hypothetical protein